MINYKDKFLLAKGALNSIEDSLASKKKDLDSISEEINVLKESILLARKCLDTSLESKIFIENTISTALTEVFGSPHKFILETMLGDDGSVKGLKPKIMEDGGEPDDPLTSFGASSQAIVSICLKICILLLTNETSRILIMDEPLRNVDPILQDRFKCFLENICKEANFQIIMVTFSEPFGKVFRVKKEGSKKKASKVYVEDYKE